MIGDRRSAVDRGARLAAVALIIAVLLGPGLGFVGPRTSADPRVVPGGDSLGGVARVSDSSLGPVLELVPSPQTGPAPLSTSVAASISGGSPPYSLTICFGVSDHTSPTGDCLPAFSGWAGTSPIVANHTFPSAGNFSVLGLANDSAGESVGSTALVIVTTAAPLIVSAVEQTTAGSAPLSVTFNESVTGTAGSLSLSWMFGDGGTADGAPGVPVTHVYTSVGTFQPVLDVRDAAGHQTSESLPPITVNRAASPPNGIVPGLTPMAGIELVSAFAVAAACAASIVTVVRRRRWRREGDELVDWLRDSEHARPLPPRSP